MTQIISKKPFCPHIWRKGNSLRFAYENLWHSKAGQNQQRTRYDGGEEVKGQGWEARNRSPIPTKGRRCNDVLGFVQRIECLRENYSNSGGLFGSPGEKCQAEALSIKRGVILRPIKRWNEDPLLDFTLITKEQRASTGWESPGGSVHEIISWRNIHQGQGDKKYCSKVVWMTQMTGWRRKELCSCHLDLSGCELTVDCPLRYQLGIEARSDLTQAKRLGSGERTDFNGISTFNREITPPAPNSTDHNKDR